MDPGVHKGFGDGPVVAMSPPKSEWKYFEADDGKGGSHGGS